MTSPALTLWREWFPVSEERQSALSIDDWIDYFSYNNLQYPFIIGTQTEKTEEIGADFRGFIEGAMKANPVVFACMGLRQRVFADGRFSYRRINTGGRLGEYFTTPNLQRLEAPWPGGATSTLLTRMIQDADLSGNAYVARRPGNQVARLRPDWVTIALGSNRDPESAGWQADVRVVGYIYHPGGSGSGADVQIFGPEDVAHFMPTPDPAASFRGISWFTPLIRELLSDQAATTHKLRYFESGATKRTIISVDAANDQTELDSWVEKFLAAQSGPENAYKFMLLAGGADAKVIGSDMREVDFKALSAQSENRICMAAGVPPILIGASEGLDAATYSNYGQAKRAFADGTIRELWKGACEALETILDPLPPGGPARLVIDDRDVSFVQQDQIDNAKVLQQQSAAALAFVNAGWDPDSVRDAIVANDLSLLEHTGMASVQVQPNTSTNGAGEPDQVPAPD